MKPTEAFGIVHKALRKAGVRDTMRRVLRLRLPARERETAVAQAKHDQGEFRRRIQAHLRDFQAERLSRGETEMRLKREISHYYRVLFEQGKRAAGNPMAPTRNELVTLNKIRVDEFGYLEGFLDDIEAGAGVMDYERRMNLYGNAVREAYWAAWVMADMSPDRRIDWVLHPTADHCASCVKMTEGGPYSPQRFMETGLFPQSGALDCTTNCKCHLHERRPGKKPIRSDPGAPEPITPEGEAWREGALKQFQKVIGKELRVVAERPGQILIAFGLGALVAAITAMAGKMKDGGKAWRKEADGSLKGLKAQIPKRLRRKQWTVSDDALENRRSLMTMGSMALLGVFAAWLWDQRTEWVPVEQGWDLAVLIVRLEAAQQGLGYQNARLRFDPRLGWVCQVRRRALARRLGTPWE